MQVQIDSAPAFAFAEITLPAGGAARVEAGAMATTRGDIEISTSTQGGLAQCWHITGASRVFPAVRSRSVTLRIHCASVAGWPVDFQPFSSWQAETQRSHPGGHLLVSISRPQRFADVAGAAVASTAPKA